jgi:WD40 repeat protein
MQRKVLKLWHVTQQPSSVVHGRKLLPGSHWYDLNPDRHFAGALLTYLPGPLPFAAALCVYRASPERLTGIAWHPNARLTIHLQQQQPADAGSSTVALGSGCADGSAALWTEGGKLLRKLEGHTDRLGRVAFHPMGMHFVSPVFWFFGYRGVVLQTLHACRPSVRLLLLAAAYPRPAYFDVKQWCLRQLAVICLQLPVTHATVWQASCKLVSAAS